MRTAKALVRLGGCPGWFESSLGAQSLCWFCHVATQVLSLPLCAIGRLWFEPRNEKTCLRSLRSGKTQTGLLRLRGCASWSAPLLFACGINRFSHDVAHLWLWLFLCISFIILQTWIIFSNILLAWIRNDIRLFPQRPSCFLYSAFPSHNTNYKWLLICRAWSLQHTEHVLWYVNIGWNVYQMFLTLLYQTLFT